MIALADLLLIRYSKNHRIVFFGMNRRVMQSDLVGPQSTHRQDCIGKLHQMTADYATVTDFAKFRGWSMWHPFIRAT